MALHGLGAVTVLRPWEISKRPSQFWPRHTRAPVVSREVVFRPPAIGHDEKVMLLVGFATVSLLLERIEACARWQ